MSYNYRTSKNIDRILEKLCKKDKTLYEQLIKKMNEVIYSADIEHYKNLRYSLSEYKRVHVGHFVLTFKFNKTENPIDFTDFDHHDNIYTKK